MNFEKDNISDHKHYENEIDRAMKLELFWVAYTNRYCIRGYFCGGFIFANSASQSSQKCPLQYMAIYSNENITKIMKLSHRKFPHLVQNREIYGIYSKLELFKHIAYYLTVDFGFISLAMTKVKLLVEKVTRAPMALSPLWGTEAMRIKNLAKGQTYHG